MSKPINKTRMTTYIRDCMIEKAVQTSGIADRLHQLVQQRADFAEKVRKALLDQVKMTDSDITSLVDEIKSRFPNDCDARYFLNISFFGYNAYYFNVNLNGMDIYVYLDGRRYTKDCNYNNVPRTHLTQQTLDDQQSINKRRYTPHSRLNLASPELADRFMQLEAAADKVKEDEANLRATLGAAIKRFGTVESMVAQWPESEELLPNELKPSTGLAISTTDLNAICGIPKGE